MNTRIIYLYRDASNYKQLKEIVVEGTITIDDISDCLSEGEFFIPFDVGLEELQTRFGEVDMDVDHIWHEMDVLTPTIKAPTIEVTAVQLMKLFLKAKENGWNEGSAIARLYNL